MKEELKKLFEDRIKSHGVDFAKKISSGGLFTIPTYDNRTAYSLEQIKKLNSEGFFIKTDPGLFGNYPLIAC